MKITDGAFYLVTTDAWFTGPDGESYKAAWGRVYVLRTVDVLGFDPKEPVPRAVANWFLQVGSGKKHILIAGCQIKYCIACQMRPRDNREGIKYKEKDTGVEYGAERIYFAEEGRSVWKSSNAIAAKSGSGRRRIRTSSSRRPA